MDDDNTTPKDAETGDDAPESNQDSKQTEDQAEAKAPGGTEESDAGEKPTTDEQSNTSEKKNMFKNQRVMMMAIAMVVILLIGGFFAWWWGRDSSDETSSDPTMSEQLEVNELAAAITVVEGTVQYSQDGEAWIDVAGGETVVPGNFVRTLENSRVVLTHDDGSAIRLDADSQIQLSTSNATTTDVLLVSGQVYTRVVESENRVFSVSTANERFEAQGTAYKTSTDTDKDEVEVYQSAVKVGSEQKTVDEGNKYDTQSKEVSDIDLEKIESDDFIQWNKQKDQESDEFKNKLGVLEQKQEAKPEPEGEPEQQAESASEAASLSLSAQATDKGILASWTLNGSAPDGFKIVRSKAGTTPVYGSDVANYVGNGSQTSRLLELTDGNSYSLRICIYRAASGSCDTYSNTVQVTAPKVAKVQYKPGVISLSRNGDTLKWTFSGTASDGYKVLIDTAPNPRYPDNSIAYSSGTSQDLSSKAFDNFYQAPGTYYISVCAYTPSLSQPCQDYADDLVWEVL